MGEIFLAGVVVLLLIVMIDEYLEAYDEYMGDDDEELQYGILTKILPHKMVGNIPNVTNLKLRKYK